MIINEIQINFFVFPGDLLLFSFSLFTLLKYVIEVLITLCDFYLIFVWVMMYLQFECHSFDSLVLFRQVPLIENLQACSDTKLKKWRTKYVKHEAAKLKDQFFQNNFLYCIYRPNIYTIYVLLFQEMLSVWFTAVIQI